MPEMGIKGAAIASVMAEAASLAFFLIYTYAKVDFKKFGLNHWQKIDFSLLGRILSISCFTMVQYFLAMATWFVFFIAIERLGQRELAIANIVRSIYIVMLIPVQALSTTTNSLVSNLIGAGGIAHVMRLIWRIARMSFFIMIVCVAIVVLSLMLCFRFIPMSRPCWWNPCLRCMSLLWQWSSHRWRMSISMPFRELEIRRLL